MPTTAPTRAHRRRAPTGPAPGPGSPGAHPGTRPGAQPPARSGGARPRIYLGGATEARHPIAYDDPLLGTAAGWDLVVAPHGLVVGTSGAGKALALDTPIPTPSGWTTMGELRDSDLAYGTNGKPTRVVKAHPVLVGERCYRVTFDDGTSIVADAGHLWSTTTDAERQGRAAGPQVRTTEQLASSPRVGGRPNHAVDGCAPQAASSAQRRYIINLEPVASVPVRCITVDAPDRLYLVSRALIPTHNTAFGRAVALGGLRRGMRLWVADGKGNGGYACFKYLSNTAAIEEHPLAIAEMILELHAEMERRYQACCVLREASARSRRQPPPPEDWVENLVLLEEYQSLLAALTRISREVRHRVEGAVVDMGRKTRECRTHLLVLTQDPGSQRMDAGLDAEFKKQLGLRVSLGALDSALAGMVFDNYDLAKVFGDEHVPKGRGVIKVGPVWGQFQTAYLPDPCDWETPKTEAERAWELLPDQDPTWTMWSVRQGLLVPGPAGKLVTPEELAAMPAEPISADVAGAAAGADVVSHPSTADRAAAGLAGLG